MSRGECPREAEDMFGPIVQGCLTDFDFTLLFQETIFTALPAVLFIVLAFAWRVPRLIRAENIVRLGTLGILKLIIYPIVLVSQVAFLAAVAINPSANTRATIAVAVISLLPTTVMGGISFLEHARSPRPSSLITLYLLAATPFNAERCRTLWFMPSTPAVLGTWILVTIVVAVALGLELAPKDGLIRGRSLQVLAPEEKRGIVERSLFTWIMPTFVYGYRNAFTTATLPAVDSKVTTCRLDESAVNNLDESLFRSLFNLHWRDFLRPVLPRACFTALTLAQAFLVETSTALVADTSGSPTLILKKRAMIGAYVLVYVGLGVTYALYRQSAIRVATALRGSLTDYIFQRLAHLDSAVELAGSATTLVSADIERVQFGVREFHDVWANLATIILALALIYRAIGISMLPALGVSLVSMTAVLLVSIGGAGAQGRWFEATEERVAQVVKILAEFKDIKMMGFTSGLMKNLRAARLFEVGRSQKFRGYMIVVGTLAQSATALVPAFGFVTYILIRRFGDDQILDASTAFGTMTLFAILGGGLGQLVEATFSLVTGIGSVSRIQEVCTKHYVEDRRTIRAAATSVSMDQASGRFDEKGDEVIKRISMQVAPGTVVRVEGPVASGKSTLLKMILGEVRYTSGEIVLGETTIGYCDQQPWLDHVSIRENITGPSPFDPARYADTIRICALVPDFENMPDGDSTLCFGNGSTLSGGQKARICLARAIYARPKILVLDDCLSGLDANTEHLILENLVGTRGFLRENPITTFLVSSSRKPLPRHIARIVLRSDGTVESSTLDDKETQVRISVFQEPPTPISPTEINSPVNPVQIDDDEDSTESGLLGDGKKGEEEKQASPGKGELAIYGMFIKMAGYWGLAVFALLIGTFVVAVTYPQIYVQSWVTKSADEQHRTVGTIVAVYMGLCGVALVVFSSACILFTLFIAPRISITLHESLAKALLYAPLSFLATTDRGSITNRFAQDLAIIDQEVPLALIGTVLTIGQLLAQSITLIIGSHFAGIAVPFLLGLVFAIQSAYIPTSSQLRLMELEARAPIVSLFVRSIEGLSTLRAFGWMTHTYNESKKHVMGSQTPFYLLATAQNTLSLVLDLVTAALAIIVISIASATTDSGIGLALFSIVGLGTSTKMLIGQWVELETSFGAMRRISDFSRDTPREEASYRSLTPPEEWPSTGALHFQDVSLAYSPTLPPVINKLNLKIQAGWKVGVCGRTGSGKSTLVSSILGLVHQSQGTITIDGLDISLLESDSLRSKLTVVPQNPVILHADVRTNLTLASPHPPTDARMIELLEHYGLYERFRERQGLDTLLVDDLLSFGEQQVFSIVRAMLHRSRLVLLDEPTSRADGPTQKIIDSAVLSGFEGSTVLYVAHRLDILSQFDRIVVLDRGRIAEFGHPLALLQRPDSLFYATFAKANLLIDE